MAGDGSLRAFFGAEIGDAARRAAHDVAERLASSPNGDGVRWVRPESYHVTLRFLGTTPRDRVPALAAAARDATRDVAPFVLSLGALAGLPARRPRAIVLDVVPHAAIAALARCVERAAAAAGFASEERAFRPHVTLGRVRERRRAPFLDPSDGPAPVAPFTVGSFVLFESVLGPGGAQYSPLERFPLEEFFSP